MIRAMVKNGLIQPLEPLPPNWCEGHEVVVDDSPNGTLAGTDTFDPSWEDEMKRLTATLDDEREWQQIEAALAEADRQSKALVRRDFETLPEVSTENRQSQTRQRK